MLKYVALTSNWKFDDSNRLGASHVVFQALTLLEKVLCPMN